MKLPLDYFYGHAGDLLDSVAVPRVLLTPRYAGISTDAKILYSLLLDQTRLSLSRGLVDNCGRLFVLFSPREISSALAYTPDKLMTMIRELDDAGLVYRLCRMDGEQDVIYVKSPVLPLDIPCPEEEEEFEWDPPSGEPASAAEKASRAKASDGDSSGKEENADFGYLLEDAARRERARYRAVIMRNIDYEDLVCCYPFDQDTLDDFVRTMARVCASKKEYILVGNRVVPTSEVRAHFLQMDTVQMGDILERFGEDWDEEDSEAWRLELLCASM